ncbi:MAG: monovalent cation/H(+) antiporter subunit G [Clostridia bacterium]
MGGIVGDILIGISIVFIILGVIGIHRFKNFYSRILIGSKIDAVGFLLLMAGVIIKNGFSWFSLKVFLIVVIVMIINPVVTHAIARSAYYGGYRIDDGESGEL